MVMDVMYFSNQLNIIFKTEIYHRLFNFQIALDSVQRFTVQFVAQTEGLIQITVCLEWQDAEIYLFQ